MGSPTLGPHWKPLSSWCSMAEGGGRWQFSSIKEIRVWCPHSLHLGPEDLAWSSCSETSTCDLGKGPRLRASALLCRGGWDTTPRLPSGPLHGSVQE